MSKDKDHKEKLKALKNQKGLKTPVAANDKKWGKKK